MKIKCICPCCGSVCYVSVKTFNVLQRFAALNGQIVKVLEEDEEEGNKIE